MGNKEIDKILKEKLNNQVKPSPEFELKVIRRVEQEKQKVLQEKENDKNTFKKVEINKDENALKKVNNKNTKRAKNFGKILSMAAVIIIVFTLGMNLKTAPIIGDEKNANLVSIKAIKPTNLESGILANDSEFIIEVEGDNINTEAVQKSIYVEPAIDYTIEKTLNKNEYRLKFKQNIPDNTIVKLQYVKDQITENSWAYQTSDKLSVTRTYPANENNEVSKNSVIDVEFSYADVENFEQNVKITPQVKGSWKHIGDIWRFTPASGFKDNQKYIVVISKNVKSGEQTLENDYKFSFVVGSHDTDISYSYITMDGITTAKTDEQVKILYNNYGSNNTKVSNKVEINQFASMDDFIKYLETDETNNLSKLGDYEVVDKEPEARNEFGNGQRYLEFKKTLPKGYYIATVKSEKGKELFTCPIQINEVSAYAMETERDVLVWVAKGNELIQNISVECQGKTIKTDSNGIAKFEGVADNSEKIKYIKVDNELVIGAYNYNLDNYPSAYIYTDRPLYKNTDTINVWGFVPRTLFFDKIDEEFYIELNGEGKRKIEVGKDGNFQTTIELKNHVDTNDSSVSLYYKDTTIANRYIAIKNYELQNYTYEVSSTKNYGYVGEKVNIDVKVKHITGLDVPNKTVVLTYEDETYTETTGEDGIAHFNIKLSTDERRNSTYIDSQGVSIFNGDAEEYNDAETYYTVYILNRNVFTEEKYDAKGVYKAILYKLLDDKKIELDYDYEKLYNGTYETKVDVNLVEEVSTRVLTGYEYNEYTKENEPQYEYVSNENIAKIKTVTSKDGIVEVNKNEFKEKENTEEVSYSYHIELSYKDLKGRQVKDNIYIYNDYEDYYLGYRYENYDTKVYEIPSNMSFDMYHTYRYLLKTDTEKFKIGDTVNFILAESTTSGIKNIKNEGKILTVVFKENILKVNETSDNSGTVNYTFTKEEFPGCNITGSYFKDGKFYRLPVQYFDFDEETNKVDIEITADKEIYKPGDEVKLTIKTTKEGKGVKSFVNVSVVNEAVFAIEGDMTNLLEEIYENKTYPAYTYSSYIDVINRAGGGEGGGGGRTKIKLRRYSAF